MSTEMKSQRYRLFIDDIREAIARSWEIARSSAEAIALIESRGCPYEISFDHDLGDNDTAMAVVKRLINLDLDARGNFIKDDFVFFLSTARIPLGRGILKGSCAPTSNTAGKVEGSKRISRK